MKRYRNRTVERTLAVIEALASGKSALSLQQIAAKVELDPSTTFRLLHILCRHQYAHKDVTTKRYSVGSKLFAVGSRPLAVITIVRQSLPFLVRLAALTGETVHIGILEGTQVRYLRSVSASTNPTAMVPAGTRIDAHACAIGKTLLACLPQDDFEARYRDVTLRPRTRRTIRSFTTLSREVRAVRQSRSAVDRDECDVGVTRIAVPLRLPHAESRINHAIEIAAPTMRFDAKTLSEFVVYAKRTASQIEQYLSDIGNGADATA